jgi:hypothetical protein
LSIEALPCIACGASLKNVWSDSDNQPSEGTAFRTHGHYGSTFFDSFDGQQIEINVCDECLQQNRDKIAWRRAKRGIECEDVFVGYESLDRPLVPYTGQDEDEQDPISVDVEDLLKPLNRNVWWNAAACEEARRVAAARDVAEGNQ